jgi:nanoRNase/pAp phosphatase (c-di-AMP/oligoRNAs hydrolase)
MQVSGRVGYTHLGDVTAPDHIAEIADLFHSLDCLEWMVVSGVFEDQIFFSVRSKETETAGVHAEAMASRLNGTGGGHSSMAAGRIPMNGLDRARIPEIIRTAIAKVFMTEKEVPQSLIAT